MTLPIRTGLIALINLIQILPWSVRSTRAGLMRRCVAALILTTISSPSRRESRPVSSDASITRSDPSPTGSRCGKPSCFASRRWMVQLNERPSAHAETFALTARAKSASPRPVSP
eukprot:scaffold246504_cov30-Tisochrysis_lutea.AAC.2